LIHLNNTTPYKSESFFKYVIKSDEFENFLVFIGWSISSSSRYFTILGDNAYIFCDGVSSSEMIVSLAFTVDSEFVFLLYR